MPSTLSRYDEAQRLGARARNEVANSAVDEALFDPTFVEHFGNRMFACPFHVE